MTSAAATVKPGVVMAILMGATGMFSIAQTSINPAVPAMAQDLNTSAENATWVFTGFLLASAVLTPVVGRLGDMFGKRLMLIASLVGFALGNVMTALAPNLAIMITGRVLAGTGGGIIALSYSIIGVVATPARRPTMLGIISAFNGVGGGTGLLLGGVIIDHWNYRGIFWVSGLLSAVVAVVAWWVLPKRTLQERAKVDYVGMAVLAVGLTTALLGVSEASHLGWTSPQVLLMLFGGSLILVIFGWLELRISKPLVSVAMLAHRPMLLTNLIILQVGFAIFIVMILIPRLAQTPSSAGYGFGSDATHSALLVLPATLTLLLTGTIAGVLTRRLGARVPAIVGALIGTVGLVMLAFVHDSPMSIALGGVVSFLGLGMQSAAGPNLVLSYAPRHMGGEASGVNALVRAIGASVGAQLTATILAGTVVATTGFPTSAGYQACFLLGAAVTLLASVAATRLPKVAVQYSVPLPESAGSAAAVGAAYEPIDESMRESR